MCRKRPPSLYFSFSSEPWAVFLLPFPFSPVVYPPSLYLGALTPLITLPRVSRAPFSFVHGYNFPRSSRGQVDLFPPGFLHRWFVPGFCSLINKPQLCFCQSLLSRFRTTAKRSLAFSPHDASGMREISCVDTADRAAFIHQFVFFFKTSSHPLLALAPLRWCVEPVQCSEPSLQVVLNLPTIELQFFLF